MPPRSAAYEVKDGDLMDSVFPSQRYHLASLPGKTLADLSCLRFSQTRSSDLLTLQLPSLGDFVGVIVGVGPQEQMVRSHAGRIIAVVQDREAVRDWAIGSYPSVAMGVLVSSSCSATTLPVAVRKAIPSPLPAIVNNDHFGIEEFFRSRARNLRRRRSRSVIASASAVAVLPALGVAQQDTERAPALFADLRNVRLAGINTLRHRTNLRCLTPRAVSAAPRLRTA